MRLTVLGGASIALIALAACAKKEDAKTAEAPAADAAIVETAETAAADAAAEAADVYASADLPDIAAVRTKEALNAASDVAFALADADADGSLSQTEFYSLATILAPATPIDAAADVFAEPAAGTSEDAVDAIADEVDGAIAEDPAADTAALDASFASIAGVDGAVTADDLRGALQARFDAADANLDGSLDDAEAEAFNAGRMI